MTERSIRPLPDDFLERLTTYFAERQEVIVAYLFGSVARRKTTPLSDIDLAGLVQQDRYEELDRTLSWGGYRSHVIGDLCSLLHRNEVDFIILNNAPPLLAHEVIRYGEVLFCRDERARVAFEVKTKQRYLDTKPLRELQSAYLYKRIKKGLFGRAGVI